MNTIINALKNAGLIDSAKAEKGEWVNNRKKVIISQLNRLYENPLNNINRINRLETELTREDY